MFTQKISSMEEKHSREMKTLRESTDFKLQEKMNLCNQLKFYVDKQEQTIHNLQEDKGEEVLFNTSNSVTMFVNQINDLQDRIIVFQENNGQLKSQIDELNNEIIKLKDSITADYVCKDDYDLLLKEKEILSKIQRKPLVRNFKF